MEESFEVVDSSYLLLGFEQQYDEFPPSWCHDEAYKSINTSPLI
jgi:hypothetical protein